MGHSKSQDQPELRRRQQAPPLQGKRGLSLQEWEELLVTIFADNLLPDRQKSDGNWDILLENESN